MISTKSRLTKQGYIITKTDLSQDQIEMIENDLTIETDIDYKYKKKSTDDSNIFNIYLETVSGDKFVIPRYYGISKFGIPNDVRFMVNEIDRTNVEFKGTLRPKQIEVMNAILPEYCNDIDSPSTTLKKYGGTIITIPPGQGKTVLAINLISKLGLRSLVIVNKTFLLNQWKDRIMQYSNASVGLIRQDIIDIAGKQIVVAMLQSVSMKDYDREIFQAFPLVIYDECHHLGAKVFSKSLIKVQTPYYLGLSATPERRDHLDKVFKYFLGDIKYRGKFEPNNRVKVEIYSYTTKDKNFRSIYNPFLKRFNEPKMITNLCKINERNNLIVEIIKRILNEEPERKILALSGRCNSSGNEKSVNHVKEISDKLDQIEDLKDEWGYYIGGMKRVQLDLSSEKKIILGTYDMAQEGLDIPELDTLILTSPLKGDIMQTVGRILRGGNIYQPLIIDIVDRIKPFSDKARNRYGYYKTNNYTCEFYEVKDGTNIEKLNESFMMPIIKRIKEEINEDPFDDS